MKIPFDPMDEHMCCVMLVREYLWLNMYKCLYVRDQWISHIEHYKVIGTHEKKKSCCRRCR